MIIIFILQHAFSIVLVYYSFPSVGIFVVFDDFQ